MTKEMTTEDMEALALKEEYYDDMFTRGALTGASIDYAGSVIDYLSRLSGANLAQRLAGRRISRAKRLSDAAGRGAAARLASAEARKGAAARQLAMQAGTQAAMDPTGSAAVEIAQKMPQVISEATDTSKDLTTEMDLELQQKAFAEGLRSKAEDEKLAAKHEKEKARFGLIKDTFEGFGKLAATLKPKTYEAKQAGISERQQKKQERIEKRAYKDIENIKDADPESLEKIESRIDRRAKKYEKSEKKQKEADRKRASIKEAELAELQAKHGGLLASPMTPAKP